MKKYFFIIFCFLGLNAYSADWIYISKNDDVKAYIDKSSIQHKKSAWIKYDHKNKSKVDYSLVNMYVNCSNNQIGIKSYVGYKRRKAVDSQEVEYPQYLTVIPESIGEIIFIITCNDNSEQLLEALKYYNEGKTTSQR